MRSSSRGPAAAGSSSMAGLTRRGSWWSSMGGSRRGIAGWMRSSSPTPMRTTWPGWLDCWLGIAWDASSSRVCADPAPGTPSGRGGWPRRQRRSAWGWPPGIVSRSTTSTSACSGRSADVSRQNRRMAGPGSTTSRSCCSERWPRSTSCSPATSRRRSIRRSSPTTSLTLTCSRSPTMGAGPRRRRHSSMRSDRGSRSPRRGPGTRTGTRHARRSTGWRPPAHGCSEPTSTGPWPSRSPRPGSR